MGVDTSGVVLFAHVALVVVGMMLAAALHVALAQLLRATTVAEMRPWVPVIRRLEPLLPIASLGILGSGAWLVHLSGGEARWSDGWIYVSLVALVLVETMGALVGPVSHRMTAAIARAADGPIDPTLRALTRDPGLWYMAHFASAEFFGIIFVMSARPSGVLAPVISLVVAGLLGLASAVPFVHGGNRATGEAPTHPRGQATSGVR